MIQLFYLKCILEIFFFSAIVYLFSLWLKKDKRHNLLIYFYMYCMAFLFASFLNFTTVSLFLLYSSPLILILFIIFHEEILQRNFVTLNNNRILTNKYSAQWLENLIRVSLQSMNNNQSLYVVIENYSDLKPFVSTNYIFNSPLSLELMTLITESNHFDSNKIIWCNSQGSLIGINSVWKLSNNLNTQSTIPAWQQEALLITLKTDTIVFKVNSRDRNFDVILKGTLYQSITAHQVLAFIKKHLPSFNINVQKGAYDHDTLNIAQKQHNEQPNH